MRKAHVLTGVLASALCPPWGLGQESRSLQQAVDRARATHPLLAASAERIAVSRGLRRQAALRHNPRLTLQTENWRPYATRDFLPSRDADSFVYFSRLFETAGFNTVMGMVQVPLPLINRNQGLIDSAAAEVRLARSEIAALEALVRAEVAAAAANAAVRRRQVTETFRGLLDKALESSRIAQAAYREGGSDLLRLLDAERSRIEVQVLYYRTLAEYHEAEVALETAMGGTP